MNLISCVLILIAFVSFSTQADTQSQRCHYSTYKWNVNSRTAVEAKTISKLRSELTPSEIDAASGCTLCEEDQETIRLAGLNEFKVCKKLAPKIKLVLSELIKQGQPIRDVVGYRVGMTRGNVDNQGNRTQFSNHSFGVAIDINTNQNGLYDNCVQWNSKCRLIKGGPWNPSNPESWTLNSPTVTAFKQNGFQWGGEIKGQQKDFMHFSPSGY
jgi:D-alanyl-D-alanine carboxypeptidase